MPLPAREGAARSSPWFPQGPLPPASPCEETSTSGAGRGGCSLLSHGIFCQKELEDSLSPQPMGDGLRAFLFLVWLSIGSRLPHAVCFKLHHHLASTGWPAVYIMQKWCQQVPGATGYPQTHIPQRYLQLTLTYPPAFFGPLYPPTCILYPSLLFPFS